MDLAHIVTVAVAVIGATWALRSKLSDIETALRGHVEKDAVEHEAIKARVIKLEGRRGKR